MDNGFPKLKSELKNKLRGAKRIAILGVGSDLRADDAAGMLVAQSLKLKAQNKNVKVFSGGIAPENFTGAIKKIKPTHIIIIDCADMKKEPGAILLIDPNRVSGVSFSTHTLPLNILADYLIKDIGCEVIIIGIQPKSIEFNGCVSKEIAQAVKILSGIISDIAK